jgi:hypothetical protein
VAAHPGGHGEESGLPVPPPEEPQAQDSGGGTSPVVGVGVAVGLLGVAGGLIYLREKQRRAPAASPAAKPSTKPAPVAVTAPRKAATKRRARSSW